MCTIIWEYLMCILEGGVFRKCTPKEGVKTCGTLLAVSQANKVKPSRALEIGWHGVLRKGEHTCYIEQVTWNKKKFLLCSLFIVLWVFCLFVFVTFKVLRYMKRQKYRMSLNPWDLVFSLLQGKKKSPYLHGS